MSAWVYRVYDTDGRLIYIGCTEFLGARLDNHRDRSWWAYQAARVRAVVLPTIEDALAAERTAIRTENPRWNITGRWPARHDWTAADYVDYAYARRQIRRSATFWVEKHLAEVAVEYERRFGRRMPDLLTAAVPA